METPYRNDAEALQTRLVSLEEELAQLRVRRDELAELQRTETHLQSEIDVLRRRIGRRAAPRALPILEEVRIASPCHAAWDEMIGDERVRYCGHCKKDVYNLSDMSRGEAASFLAEQGEGVCIRLYWRRDGTVLTSDCPVGLKRRSRRWGVRAALGGLLVSALLVLEYGIPSGAAVALRKLGIDVAERRARIERGSAVMGGI